jgi:hypothetical protein
MVQTYPSRCGSKLQWSMEIDTTLCHTQDKILLFLITLVS